MITVVTMVTGVATITGSAVVVIKQLVVVVLEETAIMDIERHYAGGHGDDMVVKDEVIYVGTEEAIMVRRSSYRKKIKQKMKEINSEGNIVYIVEMLETFYFLVRFLIIICMNASAIFFFNFLEIFLLEWLTSFRLNFSCLEHLQVQSITYIVLGRTLYGYIIYFLHIYLKSFLL